MKIQTELPENYLDLKKAANYTSSWRERLAAVQTLSSYKHEKVIDLLHNRVKADTVFAVQQAAYEALTNFGEDVPQPVRRKFELIKGAEKVFVRVKKSLPADHSFSDFADKLKRTRLDVYDAYEGDQGENFLPWLEAKWQTI
ncbi:hypothetical protein ABIA69_000666 [Lysinibacillus parviboronicapiens]|uniref:Esterase n=1 Tax=Lysinibacillus parviboronicapiens TaxID=436516 RepID=A0ABV2PEY8_9BACI